MSLTCRNDSLSKALSRITLLSSRTTGISLLAFIHCSYTKQELKLRASNLSIGAEIIIPISSEEEGNFIIEGGLFMSIVSQMTQEDLVTLTYQESENTLHIQSKIAKVACRTIAAEEFPSLPQLTSISQTLSIDESILLSTLKDVMYAAALHDVKPEIATVTLTQRDGLWYAVATDGYRLCEKEMSVQSSSAAEDWLLLPIKSVALLVRILEEKSTEKVLLEWNDHHLTLKKHALLVSMRLIEGVFPDYTQIMPKESRVKIIVKVKDMMQGLRIAGLFADRFNHIDIDFSKETQTTTIRAVHQEIGSTEFGVPSFIEGESISVRVNADYIKEACSHFESGECVIEGISSVSPLVLYDSHKKNAGRSLIMPLQR
jgi:DNA polymerase III subunit beta